MEYTREQVIAAVAMAFPRGNPGEILALLDHYGTEPHERERERVQLAVIALSAGNEGKLQDFIQIAKTDYRDILHWVSSRPLTAPEGERLQPAARHIIEIWGKK